MTDSRLPPDATPDHRHILTVVIEDYFRGATFNRPISVVLALALILGIALERSHVPAALPALLVALSVGSGPRRCPAAHWVALEDMMRGPHRTAADSALARSVLDPLRHPATPVFMLTNFPIETMSAPTRELATRFDFVQDYGDRFAPLTALLRPYYAGWPRYLYRSIGTGAPAYVP